MFNVYIFDLDGTLCNSLPDLYASANAVRIHFQQELLDENSVRSYIGDGIQRLLHRVITHSRTGEALPEQLNAARTVFQNHYRQHLCVGTHLYPHVAATLEALRQRGKLLAVISNKDEDLARLLLQQLQIEHHFELIYGGDTFPQRKPEALPLQRAQDYFQKEAAQMLMIGDSQNDILAARAAGWKIAYCAYGFEGDANPSADYIVRDFRELLTLESENDCSAT